MPINKCWMINNKYIGIIWDNIIFHKRSKYSSVIFKSLWFCILKVLKDFTSVQVLNPFQNLIKSCKPFAYNPLSIKFKLRWVKYCLKTTIMCLSFYFQFRLPILILYFFSILFCEVLFSNKWSPTTRAGSNEFSRRQDGVGGTTIAHNILKSNITFWPYYFLGFKLVRLESYMWPSEKEAFRFVSYGNPTWYCIWMLLYCNILLKW